MKIILKCKVQKLNISKMLNLNYLNLTKKIINIFYNWNKTILKNTNNSIKLIKSINNFNKETCISIGNKEDKDLKILNQLN